jgi:hypothetical protein
MEVKKNSIDKITFKLVVIVLKTDHKKVPCGELGVSGAVQGIVGYRQDYWTAVGTSNRLRY